MTVVHCEAFIIVDTNAIMEDPMSACDNGADIQAPLPTQPHQSSVVIDWTSQPANVVEESEKGILTALQESLPTTGN